MPRATADFSKRYCVAKESLALPTIGLRVLDTRPAGRHDVFDLSIADLRAFIAGGIAVHNCIGNSGPLPDPVAKAIDDHDLACAAVLSGNRNFEGRIHPQVRLSFLASPPLVVAYALAGTVDIDLANDPIGTDTDGKPVRLMDIWPSAEDVAQTVASSTDPESYRSRRDDVWQGDDRWRALPIPEQSALYEWDPASTYITEPPFVATIGREPDPVGDVHGARVLVSVGDSVTTDHISPAGTIPLRSPAGQWLTDRGVVPGGLHSYGARRGHHDVMVRGTFANIRLRNALASKEGGWTTHLPSGEEVTIFEASERYRADGVPLVVLAGQEYGAGSSRDWAAKGTTLLGVRVVIAQSYERIHRANLVQMGVLPLEFPRGESAQSLGLDGREVYDITGIAEGLGVGSEAHVRARREDGSEISFEATCRLDTETEVRYYRHGGILPAVVREMLAGS
jgi:aconitate hydratase